jgi:alpha-ketoglutarate-dependent taurine dioxygenase
MYATPASIRPARRVALTIDLRAGDMQFLNNRVTMHSPYRVRGPSRAGAPP